MPASAVRSPVRVTSTRSEPSPLTVPAITSSPSCFSTEPRLAGDHRLVDRAVPLAHDAVGRARSRRAARARDRPRAARRAARRSGVPSIARRVATFGSSFASSFSAPWACVMERISIQWPSSMIVTSVASSHQSGIRRKPSVTATLKTNATRDRERDERHHARRAVARARADAPSQEHPAAVDEHRGAEDGRDPLRARHGGRREAGARAGSSRPRRAWESSGAARSRTCSGTSPRCGRRACRDRHASRPHVHVGVQRGRRGRRARGPNASEPSLSIPRGLEGNARTEHTGHVRAITPSGER